MDAAHHQQPLPLGPAKGSRPTRPEPRPEAEGDRFHINFTVPGSPRGKAAGKVGVINGKGMIFTDPKTRSEMGVIRHMAMEAMAGRPPYDGAVILRLCAWRSIPTSLSKKARAKALAGVKSPITRPDLDNHYKIVDALNKLVWVDDAQIVSAVVHKRYSDTPRLVIDIRSFPNG